MSVFRRFVIGLTFFVPAAAAYCQGITNDLAAYYAFDNNADDGSGYAHHGAVAQVIPTSDRFGRSDGAYRFDRVISAVTVSNSDAFDFPGNQDFTIALWATFNSHNPSPGSYLIAKDNGAGPQAKWIFGFGVTPESGGAPALFFHFNNPNNVGHWLADNKTYRVAPRTWHHYAVSKLGPSYRIFVDGVLFASETSSSEIPGGISAPLTIGHAEGWSLDGELDDIRIYTRALPEAEVGSLFLMEAPPRLNVRRAVYVDSTTLKVGGTYQLQLSSDLISWTNSGAAFVATNQAWRSVNYWDSENWDDLFFRLQAQ